MFDNDSYNVQRPKLTLVVLTLALAALASCSIKMSNKNIKEFEDANYKGRKKFLNFQLGEWYVLGDVEGNPDGRIFEFHSYEVGFLNFTKAKVITKQALLMKGRHVLVFYEDRRPVLTRSVVDPVNYPEAEIYEVTSAVQQLYAADNSILDTLNQFPYMDVNIMDKKNCYLLDSLFADLRQLLDKPKRAQLMQAYSLPPSPDDLAGFMTDVVSLFINTALSNDTNFLVDEAYLGAESAAAQAYAPKRQELLDAHMANLVAGEETSKAFKKMYTRLEYFLHKQLRAYFLHEHYGLLDDLFEGFAPGESTLDSMFERLLAEAAAEEPPSLLGAFTGETITSYDYPFDSYDSIIRKDADLSKLDKLVDYIYMRKLDVETSIKNVLTKIQAEFAGKVDFARLNKIKFGHPKALVNIFKLFADRFYHPLVPHYAGMVKTGLLNLPSLKGDGITDLNDPKQLTLFRRELVILGKLLFDEAIDRPKLNYEHYEIFKLKGKGLVI